MMGFVIFSISSLIYANAIEYCFDETFNTPICMILEAFQEDIKDDCPVGQCVYGVNNDGTLDCRECSGGGSGSNYWQIGGEWMFPNTTAGGSNNVNVTNFIVDNMIVNLS